MRRRDQEAGMASTYELSKENQKQRECGERERKEVWPEGKLLCSSSVETYRVLQPLRWCPLRLLPLLEDRHDLAPAAAAPPPPAPAPVVAAAAAPTGVRGTVCCYCTGRGQNGRISDDL